MLGGSQNTVTARLVFSGESRRCDCHAQNSKEQNIKLDIADVLKGNALGERASVNAAHTVRVDGLIRDGGLCRAGLAVTLVLAENGINFFFLGAGELFGLFGFAGYRFSGQWPLPPVPFGIAAQGRRKHCWSDRAFPWDG